MSKGKLAVLNPVPARHNKAACELLEEWLENARKGNIVGVALCAVYADGSSSSAVSENDCRQHVIGAIECLKYRLLAEAWD